MSRISKIVKGVLSLFITIFAIATLAFYLFDQSPVPLDEGQYLSEESGHFDRDAVKERRSIIQLGKEFDLDLPLFYFHLRASSYPEKLHEILPLRERKAVRELCKQGGMQEALMHRRDYLMSLLEKDISYEVKTRIIDLLTEKEAHAYLNKFKSIQAKLPEEYSYVQKSNAFKENQLGLSYFIPRFRWNGFQNRWHLKMKEFLQLNWGESWIDGRSVFGKIKDALFWTIILNGLAFLALFICAIPLGQYWALHPDSWQTKISRQFAYILTVAPVFWIATLCIAFLTSAYGLPVFKLPGVGDYMSFSPFVLLLPLFVLFVGGIGYLARQFEDNYSQELEKPYTKMAIARGISRKVVLNRYVVKNAIIPMITLAGAALPSLISGALVIEVLFNIPGMGRLTWQSVLSRDWPMIYAIIVLSGLLAWSGRWGADRISHWIDPRTEMEAI